MPFRFKGFDVELLSVGVLMLTAAVLTFVGMTAYFSLRGYSNFALSLLGLIELALLLSTLMAALFKVVIGNHGGILKVISLILIIGMLNWLAILAGGVEDLYTAYPHFNAAPAGAAACIRVGGGARLSAWLPYGA